MREQKFLDQLSCKISEIMKKKFEMADWRPFWILLVRNLSWVIIPFCFIFMVQLICIFLCHLNITNYSNAKWPLNGHFLIFALKRASGNWLT